MGRYSYTQPSSSEYGRDISDPSETEDLIRRDQEELSLRYGATPQYGTQYPPQPEVEFGFPQVCYCGREAKLATSYTSNDPGRRYYTCAHVDDGECHVWKWWDVAVMEEMSARGKQLLLLEQKMDSLNLASDYDTKEKVVRLEQQLCDLSKKKANLNLAIDNETKERLVRVEQQLCDLAKKKASFINGFEVFVGVILIAIVVLGLVIVMK